MEMDRVPGLGTIGASWSRCMVEIWQKHGR